MKFSRFTSFPGRYAFWRHLFSALVWAVFAFSLVRMTWIVLHFPRMYLSPPRSAPPGLRQPVPLPMLMFRKVLSSPCREAALLFTCTRFTQTALLHPLRTIVRTRQLLPVPLPSRMTICTTVSVSPLTPTPVRGAKAEPRLLL